MKRASIVVVIIVGHVLMVVLAPMILTVQVEYAEERFVKVNGSVVDRWNHFSLFSTDLLRYYQESG